MIAGCPFERDACPTVPVSDQFCVGAMLAGRCPRWSITTGWSPRIAGRGMTCEQLYDDAPWLRPDAHAAEDDEP